MNQNKQKMINKTFNHPIYFPSKYHPFKQQSVQSVKMGRPNSDDL